MATIDKPGDTGGWRRVQLRAEHLDWLPGVIASIGRPFVIEHPAELRDLVAALGQRLTAGATASPTG